MSSEYFELSDDELLEKIRYAGGSVIAGYWRSEGSDRIFAGLRKGDLTLRLSAHDDEAAAREAAEALGERLSRLVETREELSVTSSDEDEPGDR